MKRVLLVVGTRPNFIKITQFPKLIRKFKDQLDIKIIHTGQHSDDKMSAIFFRQFGFQPDIFLNTETGSVNIQMASIMVNLEKSIKELAPDLVIVVGDVNSTLAAALTANKMNVKIAHLESGLRSFDRSMPEEINRILVDEMTDHFFITEQSGWDNLIKEGKDESKMHFVGNTMIDTLVAFQDEIDSSDILDRIGVKEEPFVLMTMHRPATVDHKEGLEKLIRLIDHVTKEYKLVFPIHPRTLQRIESMDLGNHFKRPGLILTDPLDYFSFQRLVKKSSFILTDSGGIQEESTYYGVPCLTLRPNTERPSTVKIGSNELITFDIETIKEKINLIREGRFKKGAIPPLWDGNSTERIFNKLIETDL